MPDGDSLLIQIFFLVILIGMNAFFASSEIAIISLNDKKIKRMAEKGHKKAKMLVNLTNEPSKFLATIQVGVTLSGLLASAMASESFTDRLTLIFQSLGLSFNAAVFKIIAVFIVTILLSYFTLVFGELVPKRIAMQNSEKVAMFAIKPLLALLAVTAPFVKLLTLSTHFIIKIFGGDPYAKEENVTEEEIRMMVDLGEEKGVIEEIERDMIDNIFEFNNKTVTEIMTHRKDVIAIPIDADLEEILKVVTVEQFTRFPVYKDDIDNIVGILHVKDLFIHIHFDEVQSNETFEIKKENPVNSEKQSIIFNKPESTGYYPFLLKEFIRQPIYIPTSKRVDILFKELQKKKIHMAVVVDEFGGTAGIVTSEDLLEEIVGNILDEYDEDEKIIEKIDENTFVMDGSTALDELHEYIGIELPTENYETLSGFIIERLGRIPAEGEKTEIEYGGMTFKVEEVEERRIVKVKICKESRSGNA